MKILALLALQLGRPAEDRSRVAAGSEKNLQLLQKVLYKKRKAVKAIPSADFSPAEVAVGARREAWCHSRLMHLVFNAADAVRSALFGGHWA